NALRKARARASLSEREVVDLMRARGASITTATVERWERNGSIRLDEAVDLAAVYHVTLDELAGRRARHGRLPGRPHAWGLARRVPGLARHARGLARHVPCLTPSMSSLTPSMPPASRTMRACCLPSSSPRLPRSRRPARGSPRSRR